jgi:hypothetical protein
MNATFAQKFHNDFNDLWSVRNFEYLHKSGQKANRIRGILISCPSRLNHPSRSLSTLRACPGAAGSHYAESNSVLRNPSYTRPGIRDGWPHAQDAAGFARIELYGGKERRCVNNLDEPEADEGRVVAIQSLSNAELIAILQTHGDDDELTEMVEEELTRRKADGAPPQ